jgi:ABC-type oligopeptide transport system substrate-binding subunit/DNA-binding SARP family transcriptional activator
LELYLLGALDIRYDSQPVPKPPTLKSQSLLAYLALHRQRPQPRERLAGLFWGDRPERRARRSLTTALWHIRRCLPGEDLLLADVHSAQFDPDADFRLDVAEFEALAARPELSCLQSAIALYRGDFLEGFYDDWVLNERYRLETLFSEALARLMTGLEAGGDYDGALAVGLRLLQRDPLREDAHRLAMRAFCRLGQRNAALEQYHRCQQVVQQELGAEPMAETAELYQAILDGRLEIGQPTAAVPAVGVEGPPPLPAGYNPLDPVVRCPLVGRDPEVAFLHERFQEARAGRGGLVLVHGEAGVGKTRLVEELADHLRWQGVLVLWGRCYEFERLLPYQPVGEALQAVLSSMAPGELANLPSWILVELARLIPELSEKLPGPGDSSAESLEQEQTHLFEAVARFLADLAADGALVLILDDLHWATESTLQMIHYLARRLAEHQVLIVGTLRPEAVGPSSALARLQRQLDREDLVRSWNLAGLAPQAIESLVVEMSGRDQAVAPLARRLYAETEGNPFFLMESLKALFEAGWVCLEDGTWRGVFAHISETELPLPVGVSEAIQARVRRLDKEARRALSVAAVLGREFDFDLLNAAWQQGEEATLEALETLLRRRFVGEGSGVLGRDYAFHHHKIQEVVYAGLPLRRRQLLHARAGKALERLYAPDMEAVAGELAFHFSQGRREDGALAAKAVRYLLLAGDQARLAYAHREAIDYYNQALALQKERGQYGPAGRTLMKLGLTHHNALDFKAAHQTYEEGFALWQRAGEVEPSVPPPPAPHVLRVGWYPPPGTLDPIMVSSHSCFSVIDQLFSGLVESTPEIDVVPDVARTWEVSDGGRRYVFYLRDDVQWSDGVPVTAGDFEYAWKRRLDPATARPNPKLLYDIKGARAFHLGQVPDPGSVAVRALDQTTLVVELEEPAAYFLQLLASSDASPLPRHVVEAHGEAWTATENFVSNGPFGLESWQPGRSLVLTRNPAYHGRFRGNIHRVELPLPSDPSGLLESYEAGNVDVSFFIDPPGMEMARLRQRHAGDYVSPASVSTFYLGFYLRCPPFDDPRVRWAFVLATDRDTLANVVMRGSVPPAGGGFIPPGLPGHSPGIGLAYDPDGARRLLAEAGYPGGFGFPKVELVASRIRDSEVAYLRELWRQVLGVEIGWKRAVVYTLDHKLDKGTSGLFLSGWIADCPDPHEFLGTFPFRRRTGWQNETFDRLVAKAKGLSDQKERMELYRQAEHILVEEAPVAPLFHSSFHLLIKPWVNKYPISPMSQWFWKDVILEPH